MYAWLRLIVGVLTNGFRPSTLSILNYFCSLHRHRQKNQQVSIVAALPVDQNVSKYKVMRHLQTVRFQRSCKFNESHTEGRWSDELRYDIKFDVSRPYDENTRWIVGNDAIRYTRMERDNCYHLSQCDIRPPTHDQRHRHVSFTLVIFRVGQPKITQCTPARPQPHSKSSPDSRPITVRLTMDRFKREVKSLQQNQRYHVLCSPVKTCRPQSNLTPDSSVRDSGVLC